MSVYKRPRKRAIVRLVLAAVIITVWLGIRSGYFETDWFRPGPPTLTSVDLAWKNRQSDVWVEVEGNVERLLADDLEGSRHQRFVIQVPSGRTLLIVHNIDLAPRVPVAVNDRIRVLGEYEWNKKGGLIHWTHHDPKGKIHGGWVLLRDQKYR